MNRENLSNMVIFNFFKIQVFNKNKNYSSELVAPSFRYTGTYVVV